MYFVCVTPLHPSRPSLASACRFHDARTNKQTAAVALSNEKNQVSGAGPEGVGRVFRTHVTSTRGSQSAGKR